jgi:5-methylcytosine-specific restriction endonuclease McrA
VFFAPTISSNFCSKRCGYYWRDFTKSAHRARLNATQSPIYWYPCSDCGVNVYYGRQWAANPKCAGCKRATARDNNRRKNTKRKGAGRGDYTMAEIAERDDATCHLCNRNVDMTLSGMVPMGPTIDHLVPVARGGIDDRANVKLAHRRCNQSRGTGGTVQLLLVG